MLSTRTWGPNDEALRAFWSFPYFLKLYHVRV